MAQEGRCIEHLQAERPEGRESGVYLSELARVNRSAHGQDLHAFLQGDGGEVRFGLVEAACGTGRVFTAASFYS